MNCTDFQKNINEYIDNELEDKLSNTLMKHIDECENCKNEYNDLLEIKAMLSNLEELELPKGFSEELHEKLEAVVLEDKKVVNISDYFKKYKVIISVAAVVLISVFAINTSDFGFKNNNMFKSSDFDMAEEENSESSKETFLESERILTNDDSNDASNDVAMDVAMEVSTDDDTARTSSTPEAKGTFIEKMGKENSNEYDEDSILVVTPLIEELTFSENLKTGITYGIANAGLRSSSYYVVTENERTIEVESSYLELENYVLTNIENFELILGENIIDSDYLIEVLANDLKMNEFLLDLKNTFTVLLDIPYSNNISINNMDDYIIELNLMLENITSELENELENDVIETLKSELLFIKQEIENILSNRRIIEKNSGFTKVNLIINEKGE